MKQLFLTLICISGLSFSASADCEGLADLLNERIADAELREVQEEPGAAEEVMELNDLARSIDRLCMDLPTQTYCDIVPDLNAKELTQASTDAANGKAGAQLKAMALMDIGNSLENICK